MRNSATHEKTEPTGTFGCASRFIHEIVVVSERAAVAEFQALACERVVVVALQIGIANPLGHGQFAGVTHWKKANSQHGTNSGIHESVTDWMDNKRWIPGSCPHGSRTLVHSYQRCWGCKSAHSHPEPA